jgi:hypothetical protein
LWNRQATPPVRPTGGALMLKAILTPMLLGLALAVIIRATARRPA